MIKHAMSIILTVSVLFLLGCGTNIDNVATEETTDTLTLSVSEETLDSITDILLSNDGIAVDGKNASTNSSAAVYVANDIIYYEAGKDETYGEGTDADAHTADEADAHTVVHITESGTYRISGNLSKGQIFIDLGSEAKNDPSAVVTIILDGIDISCSVAPAVFFYNVYECGTKNEEVATATVDTSTAGANVIIANDSINTVNGSYVAKIYEPTTTDKLHKYDGAFYSRQSLNIGSEANGTGVLHIIADNEGLDSEMHLTINGGNIAITSQNDGINTNEDNISVTTINDGALTINAGLGNEGDGIDSNGFIVINGGAILTSSCDRGSDGGIDADRDIIINGGTVFACGNHNGIISTGSKQAFMHLSTGKTIPAESNIKITDGDLVIAEFTTLKDCSSLVLSHPIFDKDKMYSLNVNGESITYSQYGNSGRDNLPAPDSRPMFGDRAEMPDNRFEIPNVPKGLEKWLSEAEIPDEIRNWIEQMKELNSALSRHGSTKNREKEQVPIA